MNKSKDSSSSCDICSASKYILLLTIFLLTFFNFIITTSFNFTNVNKQKEQ